MILGANVLSAETAIVKMSFGKPKSPDLTYTYDKNTEERYMHVLRVFLDGIYTDPDGMDASDYSECADDYDGCHVQ